MTREDLEKVIELCREQKVDAEETGEESDKAYNQAIEDCISAIQGHFD